MKKLLHASVMTAAIAIPLLAGGMYLELSNPATESEAASKHAIVVARITACHSPEKTIVKATAEGTANGVRTSIPLTVAPLSTPSKFAVLPGVPPSGTWVVKVTATNPEYPNYVTGVLVPASGGSAEWKNMKQFRHAPNEAEISAMMDSGRAATLASKN